MPSTSWDTFIVVSWRKLQSSLKSRWWMVLARNLLKLNYFNVLVSCAKCMLANHSMLSIAFGIRAQLWWQKQKKCSLKLNLVEMNGGMMNFTKTKLIDIYKVQSLILIALMFILLLRLLWTNFKCMNPMLLWIFQCL